MKKVLIIVISVLFLTSCTDAELSKVGGLNGKHRVELYSGGVKIREWVSTGKVLNSETSDGYYFRDDSTKVNIEISGDIIITRID